MSLERPSWIPELSLHHLSLLRAEPLELIDAAAHAGFQKVGLRIVSPEPSAEVTALVSDQRKRAEVQRAMVSSGVSLLDTEAVWLRAETRVESLEPVIATTAELGGAFLLTVGMDPDRSRLLANLSELSKLAEQYRIVVALELISYSSIGTVADLATVVRALGPNVVPLVDSLQFFRSGANAAEAAILSTARYLQISDGPREGPSTFEGLRREARTDRLLPGKGDFDLVGLLRVLPQGIPIAVEAPGKIVSSLPLHEAAALLHHATLDVARRAFDPGRASDDLE